jgi:hypothetical protein
VLLRRRRRRIEGIGKREQAGKGTVEEYYKIEVSYWRRGD